MNRPETSPRAPESDAEGETTQEYPRNEIRPSSASWDTSNLEVWRSLHRARAEADPELYAAVAVIKWDTRAFIDIVDLDRSPWPPPSKGTHESDTSYGWTQYGECFIDSDYGSHRGGYSERHIARGWSRS